MNRKKVSEFSYPSLHKTTIYKYSDDRERFLCSTESNLRLPLLKAVNGQRAFPYRGAKLWNSLEREAKLAPSLKIFKERL